VLAKILINLLVIVISVGTLGGVKPRPVALTPCIKLKILWCEMLLLLVWRIPIALSSKRTFPMLLAIGWLVVFCPGTIC